MALTKRHVRQRWAKRLKELSNDLQTTGKLKDIDGKMCCLGVLCELAVEEGIIEPPRQEGYWADGRYTYEASHGTLPYKVVLWAGLETFDPYIGPVRASMLNDRIGKNFDEIADLIEEHLL